jgi:hypothetical protein
MRAGPLDGRLSGIDVDLIFQPISERCIQITEVELCSLPDVFSNTGGSQMPVLLILILLLLLGALPTWPYSHDWGYYPSGGLGLVLVILLIVVLMGRRGRI